MRFSFLVPALLVLGAFGCSDNPKPWSPLPAPQEDATAQEAASVDAEEEPANPEPLRVVTWNVHDLYDDTAGNCDNCPYEPDPPSQSTYQKKITEIAALLAKLAGDVVMLQEIENIGVLDKLAASPGLYSRKYEHRVLFRGNDPRGINIGFLSRYPLESSTSHKDDRFTQVDNPSTVYDFTRDALEIHMRVRGKHLAFVGVHFKAKSGTDSYADMRLAESQQARKIADLILSQDSSAYVWVLGDFNDVTGSPPHLAMQNGRNGPQFEDVATKAPLADSYTFIYDNEKQMIDHLFVSPGVAQRYEKGSVTIEHGNLPSDHAPIAATFQVP